MAALTHLPDTFFYEGEELYIPKEEGETLSRWLERIGFILENLDQGYPLDLLLVRSRMFVNDRLLGVTYANPSIWQRYR